MEGLIAAASEVIAATVQSALATEVYISESGRLARWACKLGLLLTELQLCLRSSEALRGSKTVFLAVDATVGALRQAEQLVAQCAATSPSSSWPLEDAVEFQAVAAELRTAAGSLAGLGHRLPPDVQQDASHIYQQLNAVEFTQDELSEAEEQELERVQHVNSSTPRHAAAAGKAEAQLAPPQAPATQFSRPLDALDSGAVAASARAAAQARVPSPADIGALEQREALSSAAAVAHEAAAEVLHADGGEEAGEEEGLAGQEGRLLQEEMRIEAAEAAAEPAEPVVVTSSGEIALAPEAPAKGAVPSRGATPLPPDPFDMTAEEGGLGPNTLSELKTFHAEQEELAEADEAQRQLEASADNLSLRDQQQRQAAGSPEAQLAALRQLQEYEQAMEAGEEAEAAAGEEGAAGVPPALRKTRSQQADALLAHNLADLAHEYEGGGREAAPGTGAAAEPAGAEE